MKKIIALATFIFVIALLFTSCFDDPHYYDKTGWECDDTTFQSYCYPLYSAKLQQLIDKYSLSCELIAEECHSEEKFKEIVHKTTEYEVLLYSDEYTIRITLSNTDNGGGGYYSAYLYYYDIERDNIDYDRDVMTLTSFLSDFTNYAAYDAKSREDSFDVLYETSRNNADGWAHDIIHFDHYVGYVDYIVDLTYEAGYYYMANKDSSVEKNCYRFQFGGLLKPIDSP